MNVTWVSARQGSEARSVSGLCDSARRMMWIVARIDLLISTDTGPLHVAHLLGTPVIGLFGHKNPAQSDPGASSGSLR